jgi:hypothetical protein
MVVEIEFRVNLDYDGWQTWGRDTVASDGRNVVAGTYMVSTVLSSFCDVQFNGYAISS